MPRKRKSKSSKNINMMTVFRFLFLAVIVGGGIYYVVSGPSKPEHRSALESVTPQSLSAVRLAAPPTPQRPPVLPPTPYEEPGTTAVPAPMGPPVERSSKMPPQIAIIIDDMGVNAEGSARATRLPPYVTLSYLPYANDIQKQVDAAKAAGHEVLLHLPMQPQSALSPGPDALRTGMENEAFQATLAKNLDRFTGYDGVNNHMGSLLTQNEGAMRLVMTTMKDRGLFFIDSRTTPRTQACQVAQDSAVPCVQRDVFLDDNPSPASIRKQLAYTLYVAQRHGRAVAIGHPHPDTLTELEHWLALNQNEGIAFVPVKKLIQP